MNGAQVRFMDWCLGCGATSESGEAIAPASHTIECADLRSRVTTLESDLASARRENECWRALAEWERYTNDRSVCVDDGGTLLVGAPFKMSACDGPDEFFAEGKDAGDCAIDLAAKLGLVAKT